MTALPEPPPQLPAVEADLPGWAAYAAELRAAGDPRGALMELDLSLPALVERDALRAFHDASARLCRNGHAVDVTWCLANIHTLAIWPTGMMRSASPEHGAMARGRDLALAPHGRRMEMLATVWPARDDARPWGRLMRALPPTCRKVSLLLPWRLKRAMEVAELVASFPRTVREIALREEVPSGSELIEAIIDDRFDVVDLDGVRKVTTLSEMIAAALSRTQRVKVRLAHLDGALRASTGDRIVLGTCARTALVEDALFDRENDRTAVLRRWHVGDLQRRYGILPVRAQLARLLPETYGVSTDHPLRVSHWDGDLAQRGDRWTIRGAFESQTALNDRTLAPGEVVTLAPGDQLRFGAVSCELRSGDTAT